MAEKEHGILTTIQWLGIYILKECVFVCMYVCHLFVGAYIHKDPTTLRRLKTVWHYVGNNLMFEDMFTWRHI